MEVYHPDLGTGFRELPLGFFIPNVGGVKFTDLGGFSGVGSNHYTPGKLRHFNRAEGGYARKIWEFLPDLGDGVGFDGPKRGLK
jgi:hypothetical protein